LMVLTTPGRYVPSFLWLSRVVDTFSALAVNFAPALLLHFSLVFPHESFSERARGWIIRCVYVTASALSIWVAWVIVRVGEIVTSNQFCCYTSAYSASRAFLCLCVLLAVGFLVRSGFRSSGDIERRQMRWILIGLSSGPFIWAATWQIPILMGGEAFVSEEASLAILATVPVVFAIAIIQYRFMDVDVVMHSGIVLFVASTLAALSWAANSSVLASVTAALMVVMIFEGQERERLNRMKSFFVSGVSHDLKTPLTGIKMYTHMLKNTPRMDATKKIQFLTIIEGEADRLTRLIDNVLSFSHIERGKREYRLVGADLNTLVRDTLRSMEYPLKMGGFRLEKRITRNRLPLEADADAVNEVVGNLVTNAIKYSASRKVVRVETIRSKDYVGVKVRDWGIGIPQSEQRRIFDPFYRSPREKAKAAGGVGLGLALVKHIVDAHGGYIDVVSAPDSGSVFTVWFPGKVE
jgi:signal transduction histidine kinase